MAGDMDSATDLYRNAAAVKRDLGAVPRMGAGVAEDARAASKQAQVMAALMQERGIGRTVSDLERIGAELMNPDASAGIHEEAIRLLGEYLGYESLRPEGVTHGKGPDDLWAVPHQTTVLFFDAKTKKGDAQYSKQLIGLSAQHSLWVAAKYPHAERLHYIVGPRVPATPQATPPPGIRVVEPSELARVSADVVGVYHRAADRNLPLFYAAEVELGLTDAGLAWAALPSSMETVRLDAL